MAYQEEGPSTIFSTKLTANDSTAQDVLGGLRELSDGRAFRYVKMTGSALALGQLIMPATKIAVTNATSANGTGPDGATTTIITDADATWTADAYVDYYFKVSTSMTGSEEAIKIVGNTATTLTLEKSITTALTSAGTDDGEILAVNVAGILSSVDDLDVAILGVGIGTITENYYGWVQVRGEGNVLSTSALSEGAAVSSGGTTTAGQAADRAAADDNYIGDCVAAGGTNDYQLVNLKIA